MKILLFHLLLFPFLVISQSQSSGDLLANGFRKYALENGSVSYTISGDASGSEIFTFDRYGWRSLRKTDMQFELYGAQRSQILHEVSDGTNIYRINHTDSSYTKRINSRWYKQATQVSPQQASEAILFGLGGTYASDSTLLGKKCQVWTFSGKALKQMWIWEGLVLKRISKLGENNIITTASKIDLQPSIDEAIFQLPTTYQLKE